MSTLRFVPPKPIGRYALYVDMGSDVNAFFKPYNDLGHAKQALYARTRYTSHPAKLLEMVDGEWYVLYDVPAGTPYSQMPWVKDVVVGWSGRTVKRSRPMTKDEYVDFRLKVYREQLQRRGELASA